MNFGRRKEATLVQYDHLSFMHPLCTISVYLIIPVCLFFIYIHTLHTGMNFPEEPTKILIKHFISIRARIFLFLIFYLLAVCLMNESMKQLSNVLIYHLLECLKVKEN